MFRLLGHHQPTAAEVGGERTVEDLDIVGGDVRHLQGAGIVDHDVEASKRLQRLVEKPNDGRRIADIGL